MSLLDELEGAELVVVDRERRLVFAWYGGAGVNVFNEGGEEVHYFTVSGAGRITPKAVRAAIERVIAAED